MHGEAFKQKLARLHEGSPGLSRELDGTRQVAVFRPSGLGRFVTALFLCIWLCGWAAGEFFAGAAFLKGARALVAGGVFEDPARAFAQTGGAGTLFIGLFLAFWLVMWTLGGIAAFYTLFEQVWGEDRIAWDSTGVTLVRRRGPFVLSHAYGNDAIEQIHLHGVRATLVLRTRRGDARVTGYGSRTERAAIRDEVRAALGITGERASRIDDAPIGYAIERDAEGRPMLVRDRAQIAKMVRNGVVISVILAAVLALVFVVARPFPGGSPGALLATAVLGSFLGLIGGATLRLATSREWTVARPGRIEHHRDWLGWHTVRILERPELAVRITTSRNGYETARLVARVDGKEHGIPVWSAEEAHVLQLGRWLADRVGCGLEARAESQLDAA